jgi:hypothetical protein
VAESAARGGRAAVAGRGLVEDYTHYARGEAELISSHVRDVTGVDPRDVGRFAEDYASAFAGT